MLSIKINIMLIKFFFIIIFCNSLFYLPAQCYSRYLSIWIGYNVDHVMIYELLLLQHQHNQMVTEYPRQPLNLIYETYQLIKLNLFDYIFI
jgi:hypothetical protein